MATVSRRNMLKGTAAALPLVATGSAIARPSRNKKYLILSCDGGGIRGLLTARIIERLQKEVPAFLDRVELFAGTSTGGIIALCLANKVSPTDLVSLYEENGIKIFPPRAKPWELPDFKGLDRFKSVTEKMNEFRKSVQPKDVSHPRYENHGLKAVLIDKLGNRTFDKLERKKPALVTTLRLCSEDENKIKSWAPLVLHNLGHQAATQESKLEDGPTPWIKLVDAALATSAAPLYFPPYDCDRFGYCVDGGLFANCPASIALSLWLRVHPGTFDDIRILSIGTGNQPSAIDLKDKDSWLFSDPSDYGALAWLNPFPRGAGEKDKDKLTPSFPLISALLDASSASHNYICKQAMGDNYCRVQVTLPKPIALDDTSPESLEILKNTADSIPADSWQKITDWLQKSVG